LPFGAFVEFLPGKEGMVHVSKMSAEFVKDPNDIIHLGDKVKVKVIEIDDQHRINLSMLFGDDDKPRERRPERPQEDRGEGRPPQRSGFISRGGSGGDRRGGFNSRSEDRDQGPRREPHPLAMQFRRERDQERRNQRTSGSYRRDR